MPRMAVKHLIFATHRNLRSFAVLTVCVVTAALLIGARPARSASPLPATKNSAPETTAQFSAAQSPAELLHDMTPSPPQSASDANGRVIWMEVTAYCGCKKCCGPTAHGMTASGRSIAYNGGLFVAADTSVLPFGTQLRIPGYAGGEAVEVIDRGRAIRGSHIDVFFPTHDQALAWGRRWMPVTIVQ
jgi:3D (Asp-Asp-Asp) domain-containing protein